MNYLHFVFLNEYLNNIKISVTIMVNTNSQFVGVVNNF